MLHDNGEFIKFIHYGKKGVKRGINYNFSEKTVMIFVAKTVLYEDFIGKI
jgi:hypothetical protein